MTSPRLRLLWQSSTPITRYPAYNAAIVAHAAKVLGPDAEVTVRGTIRPTYGGYTRTAYFLKSSDMLDSIVAASDEGYDGAAIGCFIDPLLYELREILDMPVLGLAEAGMHLACLLGRRFAVLSHAEALNVKVYGDLLQRYGMERQCAGMGGVELSMDKLETAMSADPEPAVALIRAAGRELIAKGADVIIPGCGLLNLFCVQQGLNQIDGATVLDVTGGLLKLTETMVTLRRVAGTQVSRTGYFAAPPAADARRMLEAFGRGALPKDAPR